MGIIEQHTHFIVVVGKNLGLFLVVSNHGKYLILTLNQSL